MKRSVEYMKWRNSVIERDRACVMCKKSPDRFKHLNAHHLIPKNFRKYAYFVDNGITLCPSCHTLGKWSAHKNPIFFAEWLRKHYRFK